MTRTATGAVALIALIGAGCADDGSETSTAAADSSTPPTETSTEAAADDPSSTLTDDTGDLAPTGDLVDQLFAQFDAEPSDGAVQCIRDRGVDPDAIPTDEQATLELTLAVLVCGGEDIAPAFVGENNVPGLDQEQMECAIVGTFSYFGSLSVDEALIAMEEPIVPEEHRAVLGPQLEQDCGLTPEQVDTALDS